MTLFCFLNVEIVSIFLQAICCVRSVFPLLVYSGGVESSYISRVGRIDVLSHEDVLFFIVYQKLQNRTCSVREPRLLYFFMYCSQERGKEIVANGNEFKN